MNPFCNKSLIDIPYKQEEMKMDKQLTLSKDADYGNWVPIAMMGTGFLCHDEISGTFACTCIYYLYISVQKII